MELDDTVVMPGAEGIDLDLVLAGIATRGIAFLIDLSLGLVVILLAAWALPSGNAAATVVPILAFGAWVAYPIGMVAFANGQTIGKRAMAARVVRLDGTPCGLLAATIRTAMIPIDALPGVFTVAIVSMFATTKTQRVGDLAAGTLVIRTGRVQRRTGATPARGPVAGPAAFDVASAGAFAAGRPPGTEHWDLSRVTAEEVQAIRAFLDRRATLDPQHRHTIAWALAEQVRPRVAGVPMDGYPELFLERVAWARSL